MKDAAELVAELESRGVDPSSLDEMVHEAKSREASSINNQGLEAQIEYLVECYGIEHVVDMTEDV